MNKMIMLVYNEALDADVMSALAACGLKNYTEITRAFGRGASSGTHQGDDIWPGLNNVMFVAAAEAQAQELMEQVRQLRTHLGKEGIKAFLLPLEELT